MKKILIVIVLLAVAIWFGLGGRELMKDPMGTLEAFALRHADLLPLERIGGSLFDKNCASCHDNPAMHAPTREALAGFSKETVMIALEFGKMQPMAAHLSKQERGLIAMYLAGTDTQSYDWVEAAQCKKAEGATEQGNNTEFVTSWGLGTHNRRFVSDELAGINKDNVGTLELAWSFAFPKVADMRSQPVIIGDTTGVRSSITLAQLDNGKQLLIFADSLATVFAVDPLTFDIVWQTQAHLFDKSVITGTISYADNRLFVPISSYEVAVSGSPTYVCCTGGLSHWMPVTGINCGSGNPQRMPPCRG